MVHSGCDPARAICFVRDGDLERKDNTRNKDSSLMDRYGKHQSSGPGPRYKIRVAQNWRDEKSKCAPCIECRAP
jgi:hypothetical protein